MGEQLSRRDDWLYHLPDRRDLPPIDPEPGDPDIALGIQSGLSGLRNLHVEGYGERDKPFAQASLAFPVSRVAACLGSKTPIFARAEVQDPLRFIQQPAEKDEKPLIPGFWTILQDHYRGQLEQVAEQIVRAGPDAALQGIPFGQFGNLLTVDRQEIESFRSIRAWWVSIAARGNRSDRYRLPSSARPDLVNPSASLK